MALGGIVFVPATSALSEDGAALLQGSNDAGKPSTDAPAQDGASITGLVALGGIVFVPATSALSEDGAALLQGSNDAGKPSTDAPAQDGASEPGNAVPEGAYDITMVGDSVSLRAVETFTQNDAGKPSTDAPAQDGASEPGNAVPEGAYDITMVGDSVSLRAVETFTQTFPHGHIDAAMNRQFTAGIDVYRSLVDQGLAGRIAVFALGTNGPFSAQDVDTLMELAGDKRIVAFVNNRAARPWCEPNNRVLSDAAERYDNVILIDWFAYMTTCFSSIGLPTAPSAKIYSTATAFTSHTPVRPNTFSSSTIKSRATCPSIWKTVTTSVSWVPSAPGTA